MTKLISKINIDSAVLQFKKDENTEDISNSLLISANAILSKQNVNLKKANLRMVVTTSEQSAVAMDFISQRYNEYRNLTLKNTTSGEYNNFLKRAIKNTGQYLNSSNPFSPVSTDLEALSLLVTNRVSNLGDGVSVAKDIIIYDVPITEVIASRKEHTALLDLVRVKLPSTSEDLENISVYAFAYDIRVPKLFRTDPEDNFTINTGATIISSATLVGNKTIFLPSSVENPLVGMKQKQIEEAPERDKLRIIEEVPNNIAVEKYANIAEKAQELFTTFQKSKNYEINKILKKENYFSDFWLTRDLLDNHKFVFAFDLQSYLSKNGLFPFVYRNNELAKILISGDNDLSPSSLSSVVSIEVYRNYVESSGYLANNDLGTTAKNVVKGPNKQFPEIPVEKIKRTNVNVSGQSMINFYEGYDNFGTIYDTNKQINGTFQYRVKCTIKDNSPEMMRKLIDSMYNLKRSAKLIYDYLVGNKSVYDKNTGLLLEDIKTLRAIIDGESINLVDKLREVARTYDIILNALNPSGQPVELERYYVNQFEASGGRINPQVIKDLEDLVDLGIHFVFSKLEKIYPSDPLGRNQNSNKNGFAQNRSRSAKTNLSIIEHVFSETYERGKNNGYGLDYVFDNDDTGEIINSLTLQEYETRRIDEFRKYFSAGKGSSNLIPGGTFENPSYAYLTAKTIYSPGRAAIDQTQYASEDSVAVDYDFDRYGQLFSDIVDIEHQAKDLGAVNPVLTKKSNSQNINNKIYSSATTLLEEKFGVSIKEAPSPEFNPPRIIIKDIKTTLYNFRDRENCWQNPGLPLVPSVIGGENAEISSTQNYLEQAGEKIKNQNSERDKGDIDAKLNAQDRKDRAIKLPFILLGELTLDKKIHNFGTKDKTVFNSLTALRKALNITKNNIEASIESTYINQMPNQIKSMLVFSSTDGKSSFGPTAFDACRPRIKDSNSDKSSVDLVSFFNDQEDIPPYPQTEDPMKNYAKFLAFWMNYRQVAVVEYLDGFSSLKPTENNSELLDNKLKLSNWSTFDASVSERLLESGGSLLCRVRTMAVGDYLQILSEANLSSTQIGKIIEYFEPKDILNLPTYNQYFYIKSEVPEIEVQELQTTQTTQTMQTNQTQSATSGY